MQSEAHSLYLGHYGGTARAIPGAARPGLRFESVWGVCSASCGLSSGLGGQNSTVLMVFSDMVKFHDFG